VDFIEKRKRGLERFLAQVVCHKILKKDKATIVFLSAAKADIKLAKAKPTRKEATLAESSSA